VVGDNEYGLRIHSLDFAPFFSHGSKGTWIKKKMLALNQYLRQNEENELSDW
jgi:hypothetical protein